MTDPPISDARGERASLEALREVTGSWWVLLLVGVLSVIAGAIVLVKPHHSLTVLLIVSGIYIVLSSLLEVSLAFVSRSPTAALFGVLGIVIGVLLIRHPIDSVLAATLLVGLWFVAIGVIRALDALGLHRGAWALAVALLQIVVGVVLIASPHIGLATLALLIGIAFILNGIALVGLGVVIRALHRAVPLTAQTSADPASSPPMSA